MKAALAPSSSSLLEMPNVVVLNSRPPTLTESAVTPRTEPPEESEELWRSVAQPARTSIELSPSANAACLLIFATPLDGGRRNERRSSAFLSRHAGLIQRRDLHWAGGSVQIGLQD